MPRYIFALIAHKRSRLKPFQNERVLVCCAQSHNKKKNRYQMRLLPNVNELPRRYRKRSAEKFDGCRARKPLSSPNRGRTKIFYKEKIRSRRVPCTRPETYGTRRKLLLFASDFSERYLLSVCVINHLASRSYRTRKCRVDERFQRLNRDRS